MHLSKVEIKNYRGIKELTVEFDPKLNIFIGENGSFKSALIDVIRLLYNLGEPMKDIGISFDDFYEEYTEDKGLIKANKIELTYSFSGLTNEQKGAFYEYMVIDPENTENDHAKIAIIYEDDGGRYPKFSFNTGNLEGQKADYNTFELFQHYYLGALRDSTRDLLNTRSNVMGRVINRRVERNESKDEIEEIIKVANNALLERREVTESRDGVNKNLRNIFGQVSGNKIGVHIERSKTEYIVNAIKPYLPHNTDTLKDDGFQLWQNSLGFNNLIYIATVLGDINDKVHNQTTPHFALLIEEPEAHLHPQLQLNLYNFLKDASSPDNSQLFITTHSPTLTSKVPLENLLLLEDNKCHRLDKKFLNRENGELGVNNNGPNQKELIDNKKKLERYIDVTKSQLFYAKAVLFVEGISEELLIGAFAKIKNSPLEDYRIEVVNVGGTSFQPFLYLFNSNDSNNRLNKSVTVLTDDDRFSESKDSQYSFNNLINDYSKIDELHERIENSKPNKRIDNLRKVANESETIYISSNKKTLEYEIAVQNIPKNRNHLKDNFLFSFIEEIDNEKASKIINYTDTFQQDEMDKTLREKVGILLWKAIPNKASFAQDFSLRLIENYDENQDNFKVPSYIEEGLNHITSNNGV